MNSARVAALLRDLADALEAPDESAEERPVAEAPRKRTRPFPAPLNPVSDTDRMRAQRMIRRRGMAP